MWILVGRILFGMIVGLFGTYVGVPLRKKTCKKMLQLFEKGTQDGRKSKLELTRL